MSGCSRIDVLPENLGSLERLQELEACYTAITKMPWSVLLLPKLKRLCFRGNEDVPVESSVSAEHKDELAESSVSTEHKDELAESSESSYKHERRMPNSIIHLLLLNLSKCDIVHIPESISELSKLRVLKLFRCSKLQSLPKQLPLSIKFIDVRHCPKLPISKTLTVWTAINGLSFMISGNSNAAEELDDELFFFKYIEDLIYHEKPFEIRAHFPDGTRVPNWCRHWMSGSSVRAKLPIDTEGSNSWCMGFALFVAFEILENENFQKSWELEKTVCHFSTCEGRLEHPLVFQNFDGYSVGSSYGLCCYEPRGGQFARQLNEGSRQFEASVTTNRPDLEVKGCGIHFIWQQYVADFVNNLIVPIANHQHPGFELWSAL